MTTLAIVGDATSLLAERVHHSWRFYGSPEADGVFILCRPDVCPYEIARQRGIDAGETGWLRMDRDEVAEFACDGDDE